MHQAVHVGIFLYKFRGEAVELAEQAYKPGWALDLNYGYREGNLPSGEPRSDFVSVAVTVDLPIFRSLLNKIIYHTEHFFMATCKR